VTHGILKEPVHEVEVSEDEAMKKINTKRMKMQKREKLRRRRRRQWSI
jgi:hypothetical protein